MSTNWVVTAAHCYSDEEKTNTYVQVGEQEICHFGTKNLIKVDWHVHHAYDNDTVDNDIALLKLRKPVKFSNYSVVFS